MAKRKRVTQAQANDAAALVVRAASEVVAEKAAGQQSVQAERFEHAVEEAYGYLAVFSPQSSKDDVPPYGSPARDVWLSAFWPQEPILAGAVYAMVSKVGAWSYTLTGGRNQVSRSAAILNDAEAGAGWTPFVEKFVLDVLTLDRGGFVEVAHTGKDLAQGPVTGIFNFDALRCRQTGNADWPAVWLDEGGRWHKLPFGTVVNQVLMPSTRSQWVGIGYSPVSRAVTSTKILMLLAQYDQQKLANLPPDGIAAVTGLTLDQLTKAFQPYKAHRGNRGSSVFPGVLWLAGGGTGASPNVKVELTSFAQMPEQFDRALTVEIYVKTIALCFGVDVAEFWLVQHAGATKASETIMHAKSKGKGPGDLASGIERWVNSFVVPAGVDFAFDLKDDAADAERALVRKDVAEYVRRLWEPTPETGAGIITTEQALRLLAEEQVVPADMSVEPEVVMDDTDKRMRRKAYERGEPIIRMDRQGRVLRRWPASMQFALGEKASLDEEIADLPVWRRADVGDFGHAVAEAADGYIDGIDARLDALAGVEVEPGVAL